MLADAGAYVGPAMARAWASRGHDLVIGDPAPGLVDELQELGAQVVAVTGVGNQARPESAPQLVAAALDGGSRFTTGQFVAYADGWA